MIILAIDPGKGGALVTRWPDGQVDVRDMPETEREILDDLLECAQYKPRCWIEWVNGIPGKGGAAQFTFGANYGGVRMALHAAGIKFDAVRAGVWQRPFMLPSTKSAGTQSRKKAAHRARAQELFPSVKVTNRNADALLISEWAAREVGA